MNHVALTVKKAVAGALGEASMENFTASLEAYQDDIDAITEDQEIYSALAEGLESIVVSAESISERDHIAHRALRLSAIEQMKVAGLSASEATALFPSLESDQDGKPSSIRAGWERFKAFLLKLWNFIKKAAEKIFEVVKELLRKSSVAEKMAIRQLRGLQSAFNEVKNGLSIKPHIPLRPGHRYLLSSEGKLVGLQGLRANVTHYQAQRDKMQVVLPKMIDDMCDRLTDVIDQLNVTQSDEVTSASIEEHTNAILEIVRPMFPAYLAKTLGAQDYKLPLIFDRAVEISNPKADDFDLDTAEGAGLYIGQLGTSISHSEVAVDFEKMDPFPALNQREIQELFKVAKSLIDESQSSKQALAWAKTAQRVKNLRMDINSIVNVVLKREGLTKEARTTLRLILSTQQAAARWAAAPYVQINAVNIRVVQSLIAMLNDQIRNYELVDTLEERQKKSVKEDDGKKAGK